jgi:hypothetical protein
MQVCLTRYPSKLGSSRLTITVHEKKKYKINLKQNKHFYESLQVKQGVNKVYNRHNVHCKKRDISSHY